MLITAIIYIVVLGVVFALLFGVLYKYVLFPRITKRYRKINQDQEAENLLIKQNLENIKGAAGILDKYNIEHKQNISILKTRGLITKYNKWQQPIKILRITLSIIAAIVATFSLSFVVYDTNAMTANDFVLICTFMFFVAFVFWGKSLEAYYKGDIEKNMKKEFFKIIQFSKNPLETLEKISEWMKNHKDISDDFKHNVEELYEKWLKEYLKAN